MLDLEDLEYVIDKITEKIILANRTDEIEGLLSDWGMEELVKPSSSYEPNKKGKILVIGASEIKEKVLNGIITSLDLDKNRFEFCLDYEKSKTYQYSKLRYNPNYSAVIFGPVPHSSTGKKDSSSVIAEMKNNEGYPNIKVLSGNSTVKITKTNFKKALIELIDENYI